MAGMSRDRIKSWIAVGGIHRIHRGVYAVGHAGLTHHGRWKAATLAIPHSVLSHRSAAELWQMLRPTGGDPQVTVPYASWCATLADPARVATAAQVRRATREAETRGLPLRAGHISSRTDSGLEDDFFALCEHYRVPSPEKNARIGRYRVDFLWRPERLIAKVDGYIYHRGRTAFRDDRERDIWLELRGFTVVRFDDTRIDDDPAGIAEDLLRLLAIRAA